MKTQRLTLVMSTSCAQSSLAASPLTDLVPVTGVDPMFEHASGHPATWPVELAGV